jgi:hypothetical protein
MASRGGRRPSRSQLNVSFELCHVRLSFVRSQTTSAVVKNRSTRRTKGGCRMPSRRRMSRAGVEC